MTQWNKLTDEDRERALKSMPDMLEGFMKTWGWLHFAKAIEDICREKNAAPAPDVQPVAWLYEDTLPPEYPLELMFPYSIVDFVRLYPVFMPQPAADVQELVDVLRAIINDGMHCDVVPHLHRRAKAALAKWEGK